MKTILIASLCAFWAATYSVGCGRAIGIGAVDGAVETGALAIAQALVAVLFVWCGVCAVLGQRSARGDVLDVARLAFAGATVVSAAMVVSGVGPISTGSLTAQLAALGVTYLVVRAEAAALGVPQQATQPGDTARLLALGAVHGTLLARRSRRGVTAENDA